MGIKPWQVAVIVLGLVIGCGLIVYSTVATGEPELNHIVFCVDVETGDLYRIDTAKYRVLVPARNPDTKRISLMRVHKDDHGTWSVSKRDLGTIGVLDKDVKNNAVNPETGELLLPVKALINYVRKD